MANWLAERADEAKFAEAHCIPTHNHGRDGNVVCRAREVLMFVIHRKPSRDPKSLCAVAQENEGFQMIGYVSIRNSAGEEWFGHLGVPSIKVRNVDPNKMLAAPASLVAELRASHYVPQGVALDDLVLHEIAIDARIVDGRPVQTDIMPEPGAIVMPLEKHKAEDFLTTLLKGVVRRGRGRPRKSMVAASTAD
jgi:hypothetical protein